MKIVIVGSMSASKEMVEVEEKLKKMGHNVVLPDFTHEYAQKETIEKELTESAREKMEYDLIRGYFEKIKECNALLVVNVERKGIQGYVGGNSFLEMGFAHVLKKLIYLLYQIPEISYKDEIVAMKPIVLDGDLSLIK